MYKGDICRIVTRYLVINLNGPINLRSEFHPEEMTQRVGLMESSWMLLVQSSRHGTSQVRFERGSWMLISLTAERIKERQPYFPYLCHGIPLRCEFCATQSLLCDTQTRKPGENPSLREEHGMAAE